MPHGELRGRCHDDRRYDRRQRVADEIARAHPCFPSPRSRASNKTRICCAKWRVGTKRSDALLGQVELVVEDDTSRTAREYHRTLRQKCRLDDRVRHEDYCHPPLIPELVQVLVELLAGNLIKRGERLVEEQ